MPETVKMALSGCCQTITNVANSRDKNFLKFPLDNGHFITGGKIYQEFSNQNWNIMRNGMEIGVGVDALVIGGDVGYKHVVFPNLDYQVDESGLFAQGNLFGFHEEDGCIFYEIGAGLFLFIGAEVDVKINVTSAKKEIQKWFEGLFDKDCNLEE